MPATENVFNASHRILALSLFGGHLEWDCGCELILALLLIVETSCKNLIVHSPEARLGSDLKTSVIRGPCAISGVTSHGDSPAKKGSAKEGIRPIHPRCKFLNLPISSVTGVMEQTHRRHWKERFHFRLHRRFLRCSCKPARFERRYLCKPVQCC